MSYSPESGIDTIPHPAAPSPTASTLPAPAPFKTCTCCKKTYDTPESFLALPHAPGKGSGRMTLSAVDVVWVVQRNCTCGSTLAVEVLP